MGSANKIKLLPAAMCHKTENYSFQKLNEEITLVQISPMIQSIRTTLQNKLNYLQHYSIS
jgi:hypothetical protein